MPFTLAHLAVAMPFLRHNRRFHMGAMVLGCMAPDFEYFLRGRPYGIYGHTPLGMLWLDLPLVIVFYLVGRYVVLPAVEKFLPCDLPARPHVGGSRFRAAMIFGGSALIGIFSHIVWDSFTHADGAMVKRIAMLSGTLLSIPIYKILQHGSTLVGLIVIACFLFPYCKRHQNLGGASFWSRVLFWAVLAVLMLVTFALWCAVDSVSASQYGILAVRLVDSAAVGLLLLSVLLKLGSMREWRGV